MRASSYVRANGGFGPAHIVDAADAALINAERLTRMYGDFDRNRDHVRAEAHHSRPGGKFYGGSPPPWMDDADEWETVSLATVLGELAILGTSAQ